MNKKTETIYSIGDYITAYERWLNTPAVINSTGMKVNVKGKWYDKAEFDAHNPKPVFQPTPKRDQFGVPTEI
jgi:hypothetical protein